MFGVFTEITGDNAATHLAAFERGFRDTRPLVQRLVDRFADLERDYIDRSVDPQGRAFADLAPSTIRRKQAAGNPYPAVPLKGTMAMYESIRGQVLSSEEGIAGPDVPYAIYHVSKEARTSNLPRRNFVITEDDSRAVRPYVETEVDRFTRKVLRKGSGG